MRVTAQDSLGAFSLCALLLKSIYQGERLPVTLKSNKHTLALFLGFIAWSWLGVAAAAPATPGTSQSPALAMTPIPAPPAISARNHVLVDFNSGHVLAGSNEDQRVEPASITKLMAEYVIFNEIRAGNLDLTDMVTISENAWRMPGSRMFVNERSKVPVEQLLQGMIVQSGNDATVALAEHIAGSEGTFVELMNQHARRLGLDNTHFVNSTGLPAPNHHMSARDIALLSATLIREFPDYYGKWHSQKEFRHNDITQYNRNRLLWRDSSVDGVKTGHTESAGYCLVTSAQRDGMRLISVVIGAKSEEARADESQAMLNYGFRFFETHKLYSADQPLTRTRVWKGSTDMLPLGLGRDLYVTIPRGQYKQMNASMTINGGITAPAAKGTVHGSVRIALNDSIVAEEPLVALQDVEEGGILRRLKDSVMMWFEFE